MTQLIDVPGLLAWFQVNGKSYPWTKRPTPYRVWISEIMLQQTVITTVVPFFSRWMRAFPSVHKLAQASEEELLRTWEGLGYYSRVRNIHKTARILNSICRGRLPADYHELCRLPGIGPYSAAAIMSIAYNQPYAVQDANVLRILQRLLAFPASGKAERAQMAALLEKALPPACPGLFNQALMQLGQLVCKRSVPACPDCPLQKACLAYSQGIQETIPHRSQHTVICRERVVAIFCTEEECYVVKEGRGLFKNLMRFPGWPPGTLPGAIGEICRSAQVVLLLAARDHFYTHYRERLSPVLYLFAKKPDPGLPAGCWVARERLSALPFPSVYRKIIDEVQTRDKHFPKPC